jgi:hypothetical protein
MDEKCFMKVAGEVVNYVLRLINFVVYGEAIEETRLKSASYLTGMDVSEGTLREDDRWRRVEAHRMLREYLRGGLKDWNTVRGMLASELSYNLSKSFTSLMHFSLVDLAGGGYWSAGKEDADRVVDYVLRASLSFMKRTEFGNLTWLTVVRDSLLYPMWSFVLRLLAGLQVKEWKETNGYVEGMKRLGALTYGAVSYDLLLRERVNVYKVAEWHYDNDFRERQEQYKSLTWSDSDIVDDYAPYGLLIMPCFEKKEKLEKVALEGDFHIWQVRIEPEDLISSAQEIKQRLEGFPPHMKETYKKYEEIVSELLYRRKKTGDKNEHKKTLTIPLTRVKGLWNGWVGSLLGGLVKVSEEGKILYLQMVEPPFWDYYFDGATSMWLTAITLPISRQVIHVYSHMSKFLLEKAKRIAFEEIAEKKLEKKELEKITKEIEKRLARLHSKGSGWVSDELRQIPPRPLPSIYEQVVHTPTVLIGMAYGALSSISLALGLEPEIPPDPSDLMELGPVKEVWGQEWSKLKEHPEFSNSLDLLRASARLPLGLLEEKYDHLEMAIRLLPPQADS